MSAQQGESWVVCSTMQVTFDRPIYFNQTQKKSAPPPKPKDTKTTTAPKGTNGSKGKADDDEKAKIETVFCYPSADDSADDKTELYVTYSQVEYDTTGKMIKSQWLRAEVLRMFAQAQDPGGGEKYQRVEADGPGVLRIWQMGDKDPVGSGNNQGQPGQPKQQGQPKPQGPQGQAARPGQPNGPMQPGGSQAARCCRTTRYSDAARARKSGTDDDQEMKLTIITFSGRMTGIDKNKVYQQATFRDNIRVISLPADSPTLEVKPYKLPKAARRTF